MSQFALLNTESEKVVSAAFDNPERVESFKDGRTGAFEVVKLVTADIEGN